MVTAVLEYIESASHEPIKSCGHYGQRHVKVNRILRHVVYRHLAAINICPSYRNTTCVIARGVPIIGSTIRSAANKAKT